MPTGLILGLIAFAAFIIWGIILFRSKVKERPSETSSHSESGLGYPVGTSGGGSDSAVD